MRSKSNETRASVVARPRAGDANARETPVVSVVVPAYNCEDFVDEAIRSALNQTEARIEVLVVEDCSTDGTRQIIDAIRGDDRIKLFKNETNLGSASSRNKAIEAASGDWVGFLDSDDWWANDRVERLLETAEVHAADMVADDLAFVTEDGRRVLGSFLGEEGIALPGPVLIDGEDFMQGNLGGVRSERVALLQPLIRRSLLIDHRLRLDTSCEPSEDFHLYARCLLRGARFVLVPSTGYFYRQREGSLSRMPPRKLLSRQRTIALSLLSEPYVRARRHLVDGLERELHRVDRADAFYTLRESLLAGDLRRGLSTALTHPTSVSDLVLHLVRDLRSRVARRLRPGTAT